MDDILRYGNTRRLVFGTALRPPKLAQNPPLTSNSDSDSSDDDSGVCRRRKRPAQKESLASRLMHNKAVALDPANDDEDTQNSDDDGDLRWVGQGVGSIERALFSPRDVIVENTKLVIFPAYQQGVITAM